MFERFCAPYVLFGERAITFVRYFSSFVFLFFPRTIAFALLQISFSKKPRENKNLRKNDIPTFSFLCAFRSCRRFANNIRSVFEFKRFSRKTSVSVSFRTKNPSPPSALGSYYPLAKFTPTELVNRRPVQTGSQYVAGGRETARGVKSDCIIRHNTHLFLRSDGLLHSRAYNTEWRVFNAVFLREVQIFFTNVSIIISYVRLIPAYIPASLGDVFYFILFFSFAGSSTTGPPSFIRVCIYRLRTDRIVMSTAVRGLEQFEHYPKRYPQRTKTILYYTHVVLFFLPKVWAKCLGNKSIRFSRNIVSFSLWV